MPPLSGKTFLSLFVKGEASTRCNVTTKCISGVRDLKHLFARSWGNVTYWSMSSHSMKKKHHKKYRKPITKSSKLPIRGRFADLFCSQSRSGLTEARAFSRETPLVIQEVEIAFGLLDISFRDRTQFLHCFCCCCYCWCSDIVLLMMLKMCSCFSNGFIISAWRRCALDIICSANTIRSYINRFGKVTNMISFE